jgi:predicted Zn-dependent peptidase
MRRLFTAIALASLIAAAVVPGAAAPQIAKQVLDNGVTVLVKPEPGSGLVSIVALVRAGAAQEGRQNAGIGNFVTNLILASTRLSSAEEVATIADEVGGNIGAQWSPDFSEIRAVTTSAMFNEAMTLVGECLTEANFEPKWVEQVREKLLRDLDSGVSSPFDKAYDDMRDLLYEDSGYGRPRMGYDRTIRQSTPADLQQFYSTYYVPNNMVISIVGDVTVEQAIDRASKAFAGVPEGRLPINRGMPDERLDRCKLRAAETDLAASYAYLMLGWLAPGMGSSDYAAMAVAANALGGGKGSIMFRELRQKLGIYDVGAMYPRHKYQSHVLAYAFTNPFKASLPGLTANVVLEDVKAALTSEVDKLKEEPLSDKELVRAKGYTIGSYALQHQHIFDRAFYLAWLEAVGPGYQYDRQFADDVEKVTAEDVQQVARKYLTNYAAVVLLPKTESPEADGG